MTDTQEQKVEQPVSEDNRYLQSVVDKFNTDPNDLTLTKPESILIQKVVLVQKEVNDFAQEYVKLSNEIKEKQDQMNTLNQQIILKRGQSQGLVESLLALRNKDLSEEQSV